MFKLLKAKSDILVVIDSCDAAAVARPEGHIDRHNPGENRTARAELLVCACVGVNPVGPHQRESFTNQYSQLLLEMVDRKLPFIGPRPDIYTTMSLHGSLCIRPTVTTSVLVDLARVNLSPIVLHTIPRPNQDRHDSPQISGLGGTHSGSILSSQPSLLINGEQDRVTQISPTAGPSCGTATPPQRDQHRASAKSAESFSNRLPSIPLGIPSPLPPRQPSSPSASSFRLSSISPTGTGSTLPRAHIPTDIASLSTARLDHLVEAPEKNQSKRMSTIRGMLSKHEFIKHPSPRPRLQRVYMQDMTVALAEHCLITHNDGTLSWALSSKPSLAMLMPEIGGDRVPKYLGYIRWQENIASGKSKYFQKPRQQMVSCEEKLSDSEGCCTKDTSPDVTHRNSYCLLWRMPDHYSPGLEHITLQEAIADTGLKLDAEQRVFIVKWLMRGSLKLSHMGLSNAGINPNNVVFFRLSNTGDWDFLNPYVFGFGDTMGGTPTKHSFRRWTGWARRSQKRDLAPMVRSRDPLTIANKC